MKKNLYLFQPHQSFEFNNKKSYWLPYSVGCLWSYAQQNSVINEHYNLDGLFFKRSKINDVLEEMTDPAVAAFSCYVWNWQYNIKMAKAIKQRWPNCLIVFGGPQVTKRPYENSFFKKHPYIDTIINGEGEIAFENLLIDVLNNQTPKKVISFTRLSDLNYPSPYVSGVFNKIIQDNPDVGWQMVIETNRGCPYACTFCDWGSLTYSKVLKFNEDRVIDELNWSSNNKVEYLFIADANFGMLYDRDKKFAQHLNQLQVTTGYPVVTIAQWAKNSKAKTLEIAKIFFNGTNRGFTISVQSMNDAVLDAINRKNMDISDLESMLKACTKEGINAYTELILGLPYETAESWKENFGKLLSAGQHNSVDVWFCQLIENSRLNSHEEIKEHDIKFVEVPKWSYGNPTDEDLDIVEFENVVTSTKYMSFDELVDSYMFAHVVLTYHYGGWTQMLSRFLNKYHNLSYLEFYTKLHDHIRDGDGLLTDQYNNIKNFIIDFMTGNFDVNDIKKFKDREFHSIGWAAIKHIVLKQDEIFEQIFKLIDLEFCNISQDMYDDLKKSQINIMYDYYQTYPKQVNFNNNIYGYVFEDSELKSPCNIEFNYNFKWESPEHLQNSGHSARRKGVYRTSADIIK